MRLGALFSTALLAGLQTVSASGFIVDAVTLKNARQGDWYEARIDGLLDGDGSAAQFAHVQGYGDSWADVSSEGVISGTPGRDAADLHLIIGVGGSDDRLRVTIPVRGADQPLVASVRVLSWNLWFGGTQVADYHRKQVRFLARQDVDIVGFQEASDGHAERLARAMGWHVFQGQDVGIASRYPIVDEYAHSAYHGAVRIALDGDSEAGHVNVWNAHLGYTPYGPYDVCFDNLTTEAVLENEAKSSRTPQMTAIIEALRPQLQQADGADVILLGDFNAPSHLDWTDADADAHCGRGAVPWPTSELPERAGLVDVFRAVHPDAAAVPGITWSPIFLDNDGRPEPLDRIDFIYHKGAGLAVSDAETLLEGHPTPEPNHGQNLWTSDHRAVLAVFDVEGRKTKK